MLDKVKHLTAEEYFAEMDKYPSSQYALLMKNLVFDLRNRTSAIISVAELLRRSEFKELNEEKLDSVINILSNSATDVRTIVEAMAKYADKLYGESK